MIQKAGRRLPAFFHGPGSLIFGIMISVNWQGIELKLRHSEGRTQVFDPVRRSWVALTPEEHVRQYLLALLINRMSYPAALIAVEKAIKVGAMGKRYDVVVYSREHVPWMLVECKSPDVDISENTLHQLLQYHSVVNCRYWLLTNGRQVFCADSASGVKWLSELPVYGG